MNSHSLTYLHNLIRQKKEFQFPQGLHHLPRNNQVEDLQGLRIQLQENVQRNLHNHREEDKRI